MNPKNKVAREKELDSLWSEHSQQWRDPLEVISQWDEAAIADPKLFQFKTKGNWWDLFSEYPITLLVTREYEHLVMAMQVREGKPHITYMRLPHPSGLTVDRQQQVVYIACTRNPNQIYDFQPLKSTVPRLDVQVKIDSDRPLIPTRSRFFPGCLYMHDLAIIDHQLYANAVGHNAIVFIHENGQFERVWYPRCIETPNGPIFGQNHIQLNSIAAGKDLTSSYFSASCDRISARRPGHKNFPVDKRGVIFDGTTGEAIARGLTRPHSARLHDGQIWVDNSGYGELGIAKDGTFDPIFKLPGWTRGLCFYQNIAFVGTSRVIPRFRQYAPGLDVEKSVCGLHAIDIPSGKILGSLIWPYGNQIFALEWVEKNFTSGFPFLARSKRNLAQDKNLFYTFSAF